MRRPRLARRERTPTCVSGQVSFPLLPSTQSAAAEACRAVAKAGWRQTLFESSWVDSGGYGLIRARGAGSCGSCGFAEERHARRRPQRLRDSAAGSTSLTLLPSLSPLSVPPSLCHSYTVHATLGKSIDMQIKPEQRIKVQNPVVEVSPRLPLLHLAFLIFRQADAAMRSNRWTVTR